MARKMGWIGSAAAAVAVAAGGAAAAAPSDEQLAQIRMPEGFSISVYADGVSNARAMSLSPGGVLYVGSRSDGNVYAVVDADKDHKADKVHLIASGLEMPTGLVFADGDLYVAAISNILRFDDIENNLETPPAPAVVIDTLPTETHHGWKFLDFGPDGMLYTNIGAPCNICDEGDPYASIVRMNRDGSGLEIFARGVRNTVGFDWHPETKELWFTDNGRDQMGNNMPPCELNRAPEAGMHFGYPYFHGSSTPDPEFGGGKNPADFTPATQPLGPHVAPLGMTFYTGSMFPAEYKNRILIAEHGSWDRSQKIGYRITAVTLDGDTPVKYEPFAQGWLPPGSQENWGRPVDVLVMPDGAVLVSDDQAGVIYRIAYAG